MLPDVVVLLWKSAMSLRAGKEGLDYLPCSLMTLATTISCGSANLVAASAQSSLDRREVRVCDICYP